MRLERLGPEHAAAILEGQDAELAGEIVGERWNRGSLDSFLARAARWRADGPIREFAARYETEAETGALIGGGGLNLLDPGLTRAEAALTYWVLAAHRGRGHGRELAAALVGRAQADPRISRLVLRIAPMNGASRTLARSIGAVPTGEVERHPADAARVVDRWVLELDRN
ncbi:GNAT family N-acetyltransferase [Brachybacterium avium]|uniref:GNAT family N-acetyltransferase n=1 Tax=Brachybacterium avium TaxID=2017485 RepID=A0A220UGQ2_9MICO|nr:GNAT family N-acetyltransferase [Brachybacterium avium]